MAAVENIAIRHFTIDSVSWTPITVPHECGNVTVRSDVVWKWRTRSADPNTEDQGLEFVVDGPARGWRLPAGSTVVYGQATSGTATIIVRSDQ